MEGQRSGGRAAVGQSLPGRGVAFELSGCAQRDWNSVLCSVTLIGVTVDTQRRLGHPTDQWESRRNWGRRSHRRESKERGARGAPRGGETPEAEARGVSRAAPCRRPGKEAPHTPALADLCVNFL